MVYEHTTAATVAALESNDIVVVQATSRRGVNEDRFIDLAKHLRSYSSRSRVLVTDVRDVAMQRNPSSTLNALLQDHDISIASEGMTYAESGWNMDNLHGNYPQLVEAVSPLELFCAGVIAGTAARLADFFDDIYEMSRTARSFNGDQIAMNVVARRPEYHQKINWLAAVNPHIVHFAGTGATSDRSQSETKCVFNHNTTTLQSPCGETVGIFHQYTRKPEIRRSVLGRNQCLYEFYFRKAVFAVKQWLPWHTREVPYWKQPAAASTPAGEHAQEQSSTAT